MQPASPVRDWGKNGGPGKDWPPHGPTRENIQNLPAYSYLLQAEEGSVHGWGAERQSDKKVRLLFRQQMSHHVEMHRKHYEKLDMTAGAAEAHEIINRIWHTATKCIIMDLIHINDSK